MGTEAGLANCFYTLCGPLQWYVWVCIASETVTQIMLAFHQQSVLWFVHPLTPSSYNKRILFLYWHTQTHSWKNLNREKRDKRIVNVVTMDSRDSCVTQTTDLEHLTRPGRSPGSPVGSMFAIFIAVIIFFFKSRYHHFFVFLLRFLSYLSWWPTCMNIFLKVT